MIYAGLRHVTNAKINTNPVETIICICCDEPGDGYLPYNTF